MIIVLTILPFDFVCLLRLMAEHNFISYIQSYFKVEKEYCCEIEIKIKSLIFCWFAFKIIQKQYFLYCDKKWGIEVSKRGNNFVLKIFYSFFCLKFKLKLKRKKIHSNSPFESKMRNFVVERSFKLVFQVTILLTGHLGNLNNITVKNVSSFERPF